jgi:hypothetical protein
VAAGVQIEGVGLTQKLHCGLKGQLVPFAAVAGMAAGNQILPARRTTARTRYYVIESQVTRGEYFTAVLASIAVAQQNILARQSPRLVRNPAIFEQTNH